jgi:hypothetical protein
MPPRSLSDLGGRYEGKTGLRQIFSSFKEHVILFDEKELIKIGQIRISRSTTAWTQEVE